jgi:hypothetical protein
VRSEDRARHDGSICGSGSPELAFGADSKRSAPPEKTLPQKGATALEGRTNRAMPSSRITTSLRDSSRRLACPTTISATFRWRDAHSSNREAAGERHQGGSLCGLAQTQRTCAPGVDALLGPRARRGQDDRACTKRDPALPMHHQHPQESLVTFSAPALSKLRRVVRPPAQIWAPA